MGLTWDQWLRLAIGLVAAAGLVWVRWTIYSDEAETIRQAEYQGQWDRMWHERIWELDETNEPHDDPGYPGT